MKVVLIKKRVSKNKTERFKLKNSKFLSMSKQKCTIALRTEKNWKISKLMRALLQDHKNDRENPGKLTTFINMFW